MKKCETKIKNIMENIMETVENSNEKNIIDTVVIEEVSKSPLELFNENISNWFNNNGDLTHRITYDELTEDSLVIDLGGYEGRWASDIYSKYNCNIRIYEASKEYCDFIKSRFYKNKKIETFNIAFSNDDKLEILKIAKDATSIHIDFKLADRLEIIKVSDFNKHMDELKNIDLIKINIEGSEYDILEGLSDENIIKFKNIQVQFHTFINDCQKRRNLIREKLSKTHECTYCYDFVWENWRLKIIE